MPGTPPGREERRAGAGRREGDGSRSAGRPAEATRLETVGRLAAGVAHDFNNLLTVIEANTDLLSSDEALPDHLHALVTEITDAARQGTYIVRRLLAFSRRQQVESRTVDLNEVIRTMRGLLDRSTSESIELVLELAPSLPTVELDPGHVEQAIMNLSMNARQAMPGGGRITITTTSSELGEAEAERIPDVSAGPHVLLRVRDTGHGMDEETLRHALDPFFTTRAGDAGTGLGLPAVEGTMAQIGGGLTVQSTPGEGTDVTLFFPVSGKPLTNTPRYAAGPHTGERGRGERILVVEDEPLVARAVARMAERLGYRSFTAESADEALRFLSEREGEVDVVLCDLVLGDASGLELVRRIAEAHPGTALVVMSGYSGDRPGAAHVDGAEIPFLAKPFTPLELNASLRAVLDRG